jgi:DNA-binding winged helix-turn-helix (wHTH) protein/Flp pilus assembly protein TadD
MAAERFAFGPFLLDTSRETLFEHGVPVAIGGRALTLLRALVEARGQVVTKSALMDAAWPNLSVEESNLTVQIAALRRQLRGSPDTEDWIATFPRVGYRFVGPLSVEVYDAPTIHAQPPARLPSAPTSTHRHVTDIEAYDFFVRGRVLLMHSPSGNTLARTLLIKAIGLEPSFAEAHACLAISYYGAAINYGEAVDANQALGLACARTAVSLDPNDPLAHRALGYVRIYQGDLDEAEAELQTALGIKPTHADIVANMADLRVLQGQPNDAIGWVEKALHLNPYPPGWYYWNLGFAYYAAGRYAEAADALRKEEVGRLPAKRILAASLAQLGRMDEAREEARRFLEINPGFQACHWAATQPFKRSEDREHFVDGYIKAGLPR